MKTEIRLVVKHGTSRPHRYPKKTLAHATEDLGYYLDPDNFRGYQPEAWIESRDVSKWVKV